jgi:ADP-heptose:LPS heptosyltransferase
MKTLVLQLARLGDIYQTWPVLRALKRSMREIDSAAELHLLTRAKFTSAVEGLEGVDRHWCLDSRAILSPLIDERPAIDRSLELLGDFCDQLRMEGFDRVINLSFSPLSSHIARELAIHGAEVAGYTRHFDGYLAIPDDPSAYFYAQVGQGRANRLHLTDLFAAVAGVALTDSDWQRPSARADRAPSIASSLQNAVVIHAGASALNKTLSWSKWLNVVKRLTETYQGDVVLVGVSGEREMAEKICAVSSTKQPVNLVGKTSLPELIEVIASARLLIGGDSGPMNIASLTGTPVLNLSFPTVSFWETGPKSAGSRIVEVENEDQISSDAIVDEALSMINRTSQTKIARAFVEGPMRPYVVSPIKPDRDFEWRLLEALYMGASFPAAETALFIEGARRLSEVNQLILEQIAAMTANPANKLPAQILGRADEIVTQIGRMVPEIAPIIRWFQTEQMRIGPMPAEKLIEATRAVHARLGDVLAVYEGASENDNIVLG